MFKIERRPSGYILTLSGTITPDEMQHFHNDSEKTLSTEIATSFGVIIDMKNLQPLSHESNQILIAAQQLYKQKGMKRSAVILNSQDVCNQLKNIAIQSGIYATERYIDASQNHNAASLAVAWVKEGIDPDNNA